MKVLTKILIVLFLFLSLTIYLVCDAFFIAPDRFTTREETLSSEKIPSGLEDLRILYFSDLDYGNYMDEKRLTQLVDHINDLSPDIILFGGDVCDTGQKISDEMSSVLQTAFSNMDAKYGKFAVLGDRDETSEERADAIIQIMYNSGFEVLRNSSLNLHHGGSAYITLVGLENSINGIQDVTAAYSSVSHNAYVITICHTPDSAETVPADLTDYFIAGHSHGGQVYWGFGYLYPEDETPVYLRGKHTIQDSFTLDISSGTGTTIKDVRFLSNAETVLYILHSTEEAPEETANTLLPATETSETESTPAETPAEDTSTEEDTSETESYEESQPEEPAVEEDTSAEENTEESSESYEADPEEESSGEESSDSEEQQESFEEDSSGQEESSEEQSE